jgi:putative two-component system response regulator
MTEPPRPGAERHERILVVDDEEIMRAMMGDVLADAGYRVDAAPGVAEALALLAAQDIDLVVSDMRMPIKTGVDLLRWCRESRKGMPVILVSGYADATLIVEALNLGADSFLSKPFRPDVLVEQVEAKLAIKRLERVRAEFVQHLEKANQVLEDQVRARTAELGLTQDVTVVALAGLAETRDPETGKHIERTRTYVRLLAEHLHEHGPTGYVMRKTAIDLLYRTAPLHDIGKVGVPDAILLKPGKLLPEEFVIMKMHTTYGGDALSRAARQLASGSFLHFASEIAYQHHERWDGQGYPAGLAADKIALTARFMAVADVYDALVSKRCYKEAMPHEKAAAIVLAGRGTQFDPVVTDAFVAVAGRFAEIAAELAD